MNNISKLYAIGASVAALAALALPAAGQAATFATYSQTGSASNLSWYNPVTPAVTKLVPAVTKTTPAVTKIVGGKVVIVTPAKTVVVTPAHTVVVTPPHDSTSGSLYSTTASNAGAYGLANVNFSFLSKTLSTLGPLSASFSFLGSAPAFDPALSLAGFLVQPNISGNFAFTYTGAAPLHVFGTTYLTGANLLSGSVGGFDIGGARGGSSGGVSASTTAGDTVLFASDFLKFDGTVDRDIALNLTSIKPTLGADPGSALHSFTSSSGGAFSSNPSPVLSAVPEPATWAMMIFGFGTLGAALRQRRSRALAA